jgi:hypothetical protein
MRRAALKLPGFGSLTLIAALLLVAWQTLAVQHVHIDGPEPACVLCVTAQHDDDPLPTARFAHCERTVVSACLADLQETPQAIDQPLQLARAPPTG